MKRFNDPTITLRTALILAAIVILVNLIVLVFDKSDPHRGSALAGLRAKYLDERPDFVVLGNSLLKHGLDEPLLEKLSGRRVLKYAEKSTQSSWAYLLIKNVILFRDPYPRAIVYVFSGFTLTQPRLWLDTETGKTLLPAIKSPFEPEYDRIVYGRNRSKIGPYLHRFFPLYAAMDEMKKAVEDMVMRQYLFMFGVRFPLNTPGEQLGQPVDLLNLVFAEDKRKDWSGTMKDDYFPNENALFQDELSFAETALDSFLQPMISKAAECSIPLVFVRYRMPWEYRESEERKETLRRYLEELQRFIHGTTAVYLDFTEEGTLTEDLYIDQKGHYGAKGARIYTGLLAEYLDRW